jgi:hypothetical protein
VKKAQKFILLALLAAMVCSAMPAAAADFPVNLGLDHVNMQWWIVNAGVRPDGTPFAITRRFFTNENIRQEIIEILMTRFGHSAESAGALFGTEFEYEYTQDRTQFAIVRITHFSQPRIDGNLIHETIFDNSGDDTMRTFQAVDPNHAVGRALALIPR